MRDSSTVVVTVQVAPDLSYEERLTRLRRRFLLVPTFAIAVVMAIVLGLDVVSPAALVLLAAAALVGFLLWRRPVLAVYALLGGAATFETFVLGFPDSLTDKVPFFQPLSKLGVPIDVTLAELLMVGALALVIIKRIGARQSPLELGPLFPAMSLFAVTVVYGFARGLTSGGTLAWAIWEGRALLYPIFLYLLVLNLVRDRSQVRIAMWVLLGAVALKGILGSFRFLVTLKGSLANVTTMSRVNSILSHEESLFFALFILFVLLLLVFRPDRRQLKFSLFLMAPVALAFLANQRRAGSLSLLLGILVVGAMIYVLVPARRRVLVYLALFLVITVPAYVLAFGNSPGLIAQPARAVQSLYAPDTRDASSNEYRVIEGENLKENIAISPLLGQGFGKPMEMFYYLPDLSAVFSLWAYIPHNTILWIWMRMGLPGFFAFWFLVGRTIFEGSAVARRSSDAYFRVLAILALAAIVTWVVNGAVDMGLTDFRVNIIVGFFLGLLACLSTMRAKEKDDAATKLAGQDLKSENSEEALRSAPAPLILSLKR